MESNLSHRVKHTGGCACGEVRYGFYEPRVAQVACHCRACQYSSGGGPAYVISVRREEFRVTKGVPKEFTTLSEAGNHVTRSFCGDCGSPLFAYNDEHPEFCGVKAGSLDQPEIYKPRMHLWLSEAQKWHKRGWFPVPFRKNPPGLGKASGKDNSGASEEPQ